MSSVSVEHAFRRGGGRGFSNPSIAVASNGDVYVAEQDSYCIKRIKNGSLGVVAGSSAQWGYKNAIALLSLFGPSPLIAIDAADDLIICDRHNMCLRKLSNNKIETIAGYRNPEQDHPEEGSHIYKDAVDICVAPNGYVLVCTHYSVTLVREEDGSAATVLTDLMLSERIPWATAGLSDFSSVALDANGTLFIGDRGIGTVWEVRGLPLKARVSLEKGIGIDTNEVVSINGFDLKLHKAFVANRCPQLLCKTGLQQKPVDHNSVRCFQHILYTEECPPDLAPASLLGTAVRIKRLFSKFSHLADRFSSLFDSSSCVKRLDWRRRHRCS
eukprot:TRINITY_DN13543_c0_g1_i1.p1 TRINITY_DN13543_c0_g1~~TRINITY_DN13543_c0_g1_i1.p1  ORF type:complete len:378 (-),score=47.72 TRINITY_DN13543_c0_g1_i1:978-1961(-)